MPVAKIPCAALGSRCRKASGHGTEKGPYVELNLEEEAIKAGKGAGLGLTPHGPDPDWYSGQGTRIHTVL